MNVWMAVAKSDLLKNKWNCFLLVLDGFLVFSNVLLVLGILGGFDVFQNIFDGQE